MNKLKDKVHLDDWDTLIVLDACRYDFFKEFHSVYPNIEKGNLTKVTSPGNQTPEVLPEIFPDKYDWNVISAHPMITSKDLELTSPTTGEVWKSNNHFKEIQQVKPSGSFDVTTPKDVGQTVSNNINKVDNNKTIIWFTQPHQPYIGKVKLSLGDEFPTNLFDAEQLSKLLCVAYKYNLLSVLYTVFTLSGMLSGKTVITSDHGEMLLDDGKTFGHPSGLDNKKLLNVPWLEINSNKTIDHTLLSDEAYINLVYNSVFNRDVDKFGIKSYKRALCNKPDFNRKKLIETLLHSEEYKNNNRDPNYICGVSNGVNFSSDFTDASTENVDSETAFRLDALGYK